MSTWLSEAAPTIAAVVTGLVGLSIYLNGQGSKRSQIKIDVEILQALPPDHPMRSDFSDYVGNRLRQLIATRTGSRDLGMAAVAVIAAPGMAYLTARLIQGGDWWEVVLAILTGLVGLIFVYGIFESASRAPRDMKGKRIE